MKDKVKNVYNKISQNFSATRKYSWADFDHFIPYLEKNKKYTILDLGCGNGRFIDFLNKHLDSFDYKGIDISDCLIKEAKKLHPGCKFEVYDMTDLSSVKDKSIDLIFSIASFHHLPSKEDRVNHLLECKRVLKKNGMLFMTNWNLFQKKYIKCFFISFFEKKSWNDTFVPFKEGKKNLGNRYYHAFTPGELLKLIHKSGFRMIAQHNLKKGKEAKSFFGAHNILSICRKLH